MIRSLTAALSGALARQVQVDAAAKNLANTATPGYKRVDVTLRETPAGVRAEARRDRAPGPPVPAEPEPVEGSNAEPVRELATLIEGQRGFEADLEVIRTADEMLGTLLDRKG